MWTLYNIYTVAEIAIPAAVGIWWAVREAWFKRN